MKPSNRFFGGGSRFAVGLLILFSIGPSVGGFSCNVGGYPDLGNRLDILESIGTEGATAWMRTMTDGQSEILVLGDATEDGALRFALVRMNMDSTGIISAGTYIIRGNRIVFQISNEYTKTLELDVPPSSREGSVREDFEPPREIEYTAEKDGSMLRLFGESEPIVMTELWDVISLIDISSQDGINMISRVFNLSTVSLQMRIPGFGGAGLLQYTGEPSSFVGVVGGTGSIEMTSVLSPVAEILFEEFEDYPGIVLNGDQISSTDMAGDGQLTGTMHFSMRDPRPAFDFRIEGDLVYDLTLRNGTSSGGGYTITLLDGAVWTVPVQEAETMDFRSILPPS